MPSLLPRRISGLLCLDLLQHGRQPLLVDDCAGLNGLDLVEYLETECRSIELNGKPAGRPPSYRMELPWIAPDFLIAEVCNAAWRSTRLGRISQAQLGEIAANLPRFFDALVSATVLAPRALAIAGQLDHPVYDCLYLALAEAEQADLLTADTRLVGKVRATS